MKKILILVGLVLSTFHATAKEKKENYYSSDKFKNELLEKRKHLNSVLGVCLDPKLCGHSSQARYSLAESGECKAFRLGINQRIP